MLPLEIYVPYCTRADFFPRYCSRRNKITVFILNLYFEMALHVLACLILICFCSACPVKRKLVRHLKLYRRIIERSSQQKCKCYLITAQNSLSIFLNSAMILKVVYLHVHHNEMMCKMKVSILYSIRLFSHFRLNSYKP